MFGSICEIMEKSKAISVIIPVYNGEKYLKKCLKSIEQQVFSDFEMIIINDGSTDMSQQIIDEFADKSTHQINKIVKENKGQAAARNQGVLLAKGKYIVFIDCDDYIDKDYLETLYNAAECYESDVVSCGYHYVDEEGRKLREVKLTNKDWELYGRAGLIAVWGKIFRRKFILDKSLKFQENGKIFEDVPFSIYAKFQGKNPVVINYIGYYYVRRQGSTMNSGAVRSNRFPYEEMTKSIYSISQNIPEELSEKFEYEVLHFFAGFLFRYCRKASIKDIKILVGYSKNILTNYFPDYYKNSYLSVMKNKSQPFIDKCAIIVFSVINRIGFLECFTILLTRI